MEHSILLDCREVWKIYGARADDLFKSHGNRLSAEDLAAHGLIGAVRAVNVQIRQGEIFVIMGLSGSGKSTLVRCLSRLIEPTGGEILFEGRNLLAMTDREMIAIRRKKMAWCFSILPSCHISRSCKMPPFRWKSRVCRRQNARRARER